MKNILLINPPVYDFSYYDFFSKPLGLLYIASLLRENNYNVFFADCLDRYHPELVRIKIPKTKESGCGKIYSHTIEKPKILKHIPRHYKMYGLPWEIFLSEVKKIPSPDIVLITSIMTYWYLAVFDTIKIVKENFPKTEVVLGGIYATLCLEHAKKYSGADYVLDLRNPLDVLRFVDEYFGIKSDHSKYSDIDNYPYPAWDMLRKLDYLVLLTSYGCPYSCTYCGIKRLFKNYICRDPAKVVEEIEFLVSKYNVFNFAFYDDALLVNPQNHIVKILENVLRKNIRANFYLINGVHPRYIDRYVAKLLKECSFKMIRLSYETSNPEIQEKTGRKVTNKEFENAVLNLKNAGYKESDIEVYIMCGLPQQTLDDVLNTIELVKKLGCRPKLSEFSPVPGTQDYEKAKSEFKLSPDIDPLLQNNTILPYQSKTFTEDVFKRIKRYIME